ncbi:hypothetical protein SEPCBS119000_000927 [Sporothrix epigloea]|uniref:Luciferase domain-containing protein n=1 Tax=Sporothrix epigloea TaxID=1892477 RepID=A0ABP0D7Y8_9PEZI
MAALSILPSMSSEPAKDAIEYKASIVGIKELVPELPVDSHKPAANAAAASYGIPHSLDSFLDRPLARRARPLLTTGRSSLTKGLLEQEHQNHSYMFDHEPDVHHIQDNYTPSYRGRSTRPRESEVENLRFEMGDFIKSTVWANHDLICLRPSVCEQHLVDAPTAKGICVGSFGIDAPSWLLFTQGEHLHLHADGSTHMILSLVDAAKAADSGWVERFALPTTGPKDERRLDCTQYVYVLAPKCASELADWKRLVLASVRFCTATLRAQPIRRPERL